MEGRKAVGNNGGHQSEVVDHFAQQKRAYGRSVQPEGNCEGWCPQEPEEASQRFGLVMIKGCMNSLRSQLVYQLTSEAAYPVLTSPNSTGATLRNIMASWKQTETGVKVFSFMTSYCRRLISSSTNWCEQRRSNRPYLSSADTGTARGPRMFAACYDHQPEDCAISEFDLSFVRQHLAIVQSRVIVSDSEEVRPGIKCHHVIRFRRDATVRFAGGLPSPPSDG